MLCLATGSVSAAAEEAAQTQQGVTTTFGPEQNHQCRARGNAPGEAEDGAEASPEESAQPEKATVFGGVAVADITDDIRTALNLSKDVKGAVIAEIDADSPAAKAGLREGDVIQQVNKQPVRNAKDLVAISKKLKT